MHEYSLSVDIMETILNTAKINSAKIVNSVKIKIDPFVNANPIQLQFCLEVLSKNTIVENSLFIFEFLDIKLKCKNNHEKIILFNKNLSNDFYSLLIELGNKKCSICNEIMSITNKHNIYVESIDID